MIQQPMPSVAQIAATAPHARLIAIDLRSIYDTLRYCSQTHRWIHVENRSPRVVYAPAALGNIYEISSERLQKLNCWVTQEHLREKIDAYW